MAKGYPDYLGLSIFPRKGIYKFWERADVTLLTGGALPIISVNVKGESIGGYIEIHEGTDPTKLKMASSIDNNFTAYIAFSKMLDLNMTIPGVAAYSLLSYDEEAQIYSIRIEPGITFGWQYNIYVQNITGDSCKITSSIVYYELAEE